MSDKDELTAGLQAELARVNARLAEQPDRQALQAAGTHPAPCARHCEAQAFEIAARGMRRQIAELQAALAEQPAQQEPVAWMNPHGGMLTANYIENFASGLDKEIHNIPLYTTPQAQPRSEATLAREPLTPAQKIALAEDWFAEDWTITKAVGMMVEYEMRIAHGITKGQP